MGHCQSATPMKRLFFWPGTLIIILIILSFLGLSSTRLVAVAQGIAACWGWAWAIVLVVLATGFRFTLPLAVVAYVHAMKAWGWPGVIAALLAVGPELWVKNEQYLSYSRILRQPLLREYSIVLLVSAQQCLALATLVAGFEGIQSGMSLFWAIVAVVALFLFSFDPPLKVGAYFHATSVWGWHPAIAVLFVIAEYFCTLAVDRLRQTTKVG